MSTLVSCKSFSQLFGISSLIIKPLPLFEPRDEIICKIYGYLSFAKNASINICKNSSGKDCPQSWTKYLKQTLVFMWNRTLPETFISIFQEFIASIEKVLFWEEDLLIFQIFLKYQYVCKLVRQLLCTMFISNNHAYYHNFLYFYFFGFYLFINSSNC